MGHGKETPRQKMIGMMYLVLTAMLAMNVSAEVLDAFRLVNNGIKKTTTNFSKKNETIYDDIAEEAAINKQKAGPWKNKADEVRRRADELYDYIQNDLKVHIIKENQGENIAENEALEITENGDTIIHHSKVKGGAHWNTSTRILIGKGESQNGKAYTLKKKINEFRKHLLSLIDTNDVKIINSIKSGLDTSDPPRLEGYEKKSWERKHFYNIPLAATLTLLSKMQADIRNAESEIIDYLLKQINAGEFNFNKLEATVIPNSSDIIRGNEYRADVFLAARDTTAPPVILIGEWDSIQRPDGTYDYRMTRIDDTLHVDKDEGKGKYIQKTSRLGQHEWGGIIKLTGPEGDTIKKPFHRSYRVARPNVVISPTKMNVFYVGIPNPVSISVPGVPSNKIRPRMTNGSIRKVSAGNYEVLPNNVGRNCVIRVSAETDGQFRSYGSQTFRVKGLPTPTANVAGKSGGDISKNLLVAQSAVFAEMEDFLFDLEYTITQFTVTTTDRGGYIKDITRKNNRIDQQVRKWMQQNIRRNSKVTFEDLRAVGPDGTVKKLNPIVFTIE
jgi:gliding motility-associated protein GldM